jgi:hypothetical protein
MIADSGRTGRSSVSMLIFTSFDRSGAPVRADDR